MQHSAKPTQKLVVTFSDLLDDLIRHIASFCTSDEIQYLKCCNSAINQILLKPFRRSCLSKSNLLNTTNVLLSDCTIASLVYNKPLHVIHLHHKWQTQLRKLCLMGINSVHWDIFLATDYKFQSLEKLELRSTPALKIFTTHLLNHQNLVTLTLITGTIDYPFFWSDLALCVNIEDLTLGTEVLILASNAICFDFPKLKRLEIDAELLDDHAETIAGFFLFCQTKSVDLMISGSVRLVEDESLVHFFTRSAVLAIKLIDFPHLESIWTFFMAEETVIQDLNMYENHHKTSVSVHTDDAADLEELFECVKDHSSLCHRIDIFIDAINVDPLCRYEEEMYWGLPQNSLFYVSCVFSVHYEFEFNAAEGMLQLLHTATFLQDIVSSWKPIFDQVKKSESSLEQFYLEACIPSTNVTCVEAIAKYLQKKTNFPKHQKELFQVVCCAC